MANSQCPTATGHTSSALFNRRVSFDVTLHWDLTLWALCAKPEWAAGLTQTRPIIFCVRWRMLHYGQGWDVYVYIHIPSLAVWMCSCACEQVYVVSVVVWTGHGECARSAVCFLPSFCTSPPPLLCTSFLPSLLGKISSNLTSLHAGGLRQRMWDDRADGSPLWSIFNPVDWLDHKDKPEQLWQ